jgi:hypothetical protein
MSLPASLRTLRPHAKIPIVLGVGQSERAVEVAPVYQPAVSRKPSVAGNGSTDPYLAVGLNPSPPLALRHISSRRRLLVGQPISTLGVGNHNLHTMPFVGGGLSAQGESAATLAVTVLENERLPRQFGCDCRYPYGAVCPYVIQSLFQRGMNLSQPFERGGPATVAHVGVQRRCRASGFDDEMPNPSGLAAGQGKDMIG